jgi:hypothetical protein
LHWRTISWVAGAATDFPSFRLQRILLTYLKIQQNKTSKIEPQNYKKYLELQEKILWKIYFVLIHCQRSKDNALN